MATEESVAMQVRTEIAGEAVKGVHLARSSVMSGQERLAACLDGSQS